MNTILIKSTFRDTNDDIFDMIDTLPSAETLVYRNASSDDSRLNVIYSFLNKKYASIHSFCEIIDAEAAFDEKTTF